MKNWQIMHTVEYFGWHTEVIADNTSIEYRIRNERGRILETSHYGYGQPAIALRDGLQRMFKLEADSDNPTTTP